MVNIETSPYPEYCNGWENRRQCTKLNLSDTNIEEDIDYIRNNGVDIVNVSPFKGFRTGNLDALLRTDNFWGLVIFRGNNIDISAVEKCTHIKFLSITDTPQIVDISNHSEIEYLITQWRKDVILPRPNTSKLKNWDLWRYTEKTLEQLPPYPHLMTLKVYWGSVRSLQGLERYTELQRYEHYYGKKLTDISVVVKLPQLETLRFYHCKKIQWEGIFEKCPSLQSIVLESCSDIPSLSFLKKIKTLKGFGFGGCNLLDGDLTPLLKLDFFGFDPNKRHYSHTLEELRKIHEDMKTNRNEKHE